MVTVCIFSLTLKSDFVWLQNTLCDFLFVGIDELSLILINLPICLQCCFIQLQYFYCDH